MKQWIAATLLAAAAASALAAATVGQPAPAFTATDVAGKPVSLSDFKAAPTYRSITAPATCRPRSRRP
jgi:hypothetical protein